MRYVFLCDSLSLSLSLLSLSLSDGVIIKTQRLLWSGGSRKINCYRSFGRWGGQGLPRSTLKPLRPHDWIISLAALTLSNGTSVIFTKWYSGQSPTAAARWIDWQQSNQTEEGVCTSNGWSCYNLFIMQRQQEGFHHWHSNYPRLSSVSGQGRHQHFVPRSDFITRDRVTDWMLKQQVGVSHALSLLSSFLLPSPLPLLLLNAWMPECESSLWATFSSSSPTFPPPTLGSWERSGEWVCVCVWGCGVEPIKILPAWSRTAPHGWPSLDMAPGLLGRGNTVHCTAGINTWVTNKRVIKGTLIAMRVVRRVSL